MQAEKSALGPAGIALILLVLVAAGGLLVWSAWRGQEEDTLERIRRTGVARIGFANEAPYGYIDSATGRVTGEAPEIARVVLARMGVEVIEPVVAEFGALIPGLQAGRFDMIAAGMYITPERAREIAFSDPTYGIGEAFLVAAGNPLALHSFEDVAGSDAARLGVMGGSVEHGYARRLGVPDARIVVFPDYPSAVEGLRSGRVDAIASTVLTAEDLLQKADDDRIERADPFTDPVIDGRPVRGYGAFGFRRGDTALRDEFNRHLHDFLGTPEHLELVRPFGFSEETLPGGVTAAELIEGD